MCPAFDVESRCSLSSSSFGFEGGAYYEPIPGLCRAYYGLFRPIPAYSGLFRHCPTFYDIVVCHCLLFVVVVLFSCFLFVYVFAFSFRVVELG